MNGETNGSIKIKLLIVGEHAVGKTSLTRRFVEGRFSTDYLPTIGTNIFTKRLKVGDSSVTVYIWDIAGQERFKELREVYYRGAHGVFVVGDLSRKRTFEELSGFWAEDLDRHLPGSVPRLLVCNKNDLEAEAGRSEINTARAAVGCFATVSTSARSGDNVHIAFTKLVKEVLDRINSGEMEWNTDISADYSESV